MFALIVGVASARTAVTQKPWMASSFHVLVAWIPAIPAGMTLSMSFSTANANIADIKTIIGMGE